ncbi:DUF1707 SHOCT-like domain-containing protein [Rhodococcus tibetensis]|uniref:DUF1707 domain-containing protein n=1 Tax=Rhodococcus tibetensis TaxID=2965064 RepID=A0ABT1QBP1_9NOCA|nr:DUF1707 domain-containing protein [Rhodococcus sp. FXJ9.536]MCQ4119684.1 DUF1707 domain-containing protein [Rhodococcus sp. FXJ9.536]
MTKSTLAGLRARDSDRADACGVLDAAQADGQLSAEEHSYRTARAMSAKTFDELDRLVGDLQIPSRLANAPVVRPKQRRSRRRWIAAGAIVATAAVGGAIAGTLGEEPGSPTSVPTLTTGSGVQFFIDDYSAEFGNTIADEVDLFPEHAVFDRQAAANPSQSDPYYYDGEFDSWGSVSSRDADERSFDLATVNLPALAGLLKGAPESVRVPNGTVDHLSFGFEAGEEDGPPIISVYANNEAGNTGYFNVTFDGEIVAVYPFGD